MNQLTCGHIQHLYSWWWVRLSPETCRVKPLRRIKSNYCILLDFFHNYTPSDVTNNCCRLNIEIIFVMKIYVDRSKVKVKVTLVQALRHCTGRTAHRVSRGIALPFHDHGTRKWWGVMVTPRPLFTPGKDPVPIVQETGWAPGPVWTGAENLAPPAFDPRTVQPLASRCTKWATGPTEQK